jgi:hypothetical protein
MSGGSSGGKKKSEDKKAEPAIPGTGPMMTQPAFMGDNQSLLAQQLAAGGYGSMPDIMQMLTQTFTPMQVLDTRPGATPAPGIPSTPTTGGSGSGPGSGDGKEWRGIGSKKEWR